MVAEAADGRQAVALAAEHRPDIALVDIQMPVLDGLQATRQIVADKRLDGVRVVILTNFGLDEYIFRALRAGASGFLLRAPSQPTAAGARVITRGDSLLSPAVTRRLISEFVARPPAAVAAAGMESLTNREREVVALVAHGLSNDEIAAAMVVSPTTAKTHVSRAMIKLGARDRAQLVVFAYQAWSPRVSPVTCRDPVNRTSTAWNARVRGSRRSRRPEQCNSSVRRSLCCGRGVPAWTGDAEDRVLHPTGRVATRYRAPARRWSTPVGSPARGRLDCAAVRPLPRAPAERFTVSTTTPAAACPTGPESTSPSTVRSPRRWRWPMCWAPAGSACSGRRREVSWRRR